MLTIYLTHMEVRHCYLVLHYTIFFTIIEMSFADPRVAQWYMMSSPTPTIVIVLLYIYFVKVGHQFAETLPQQPKLQFLGPHLMKNRKPFQLKKAILVYNLLQVLLSTYIFYEVTPTCFTSQVTNLFTDRHVRLVYWRVQSPLPTGGLFQRTKRTESKFLHPTQPTT
jgi:hypothetical protein